MPRIENSIVINAPADEVFLLINDIERWPELFNEYSGATVLSEQPTGRFTEVIFKLSNAEGSTWQSWRLVDHEKLVARAERVDPLYPFRYMHLKWMCEPTSAGTQMTWIQDFEIDGRVETPLDTIVNRMVSHTKENQLGIKQKIESGMVASR